VSGVSWKEKGNDSVSFVHLATRRPQIKGARRKRLRPPWSNRSNVKERAMGGIATGRKGTGQNGGGAHGPAAAAGFRLAALRDNDPGCSSIWWSCHR
jgi:hypothetical protein